jgi:hypothetical protein
VPTVEVLRCPECNRPRNLSPEHTHRIVSGKAQLTPCRDCRRPPVTLSEAERERFTRWWRNQLPDEQLVALAYAIWGP